MLSFRRYNIDITMTSETTQQRKLKEYQVIDQYADRLSRRLCYVLRYGALKEGLKLYEGDYVDLDQVMALHLMRHHSRDEVLHDVDVSLSHRNEKRFEKKQENGLTLIRAMFCRRFDPNPCHEGTKVPTLIQTCMDYVASNIQEYDLQDFPDEFLINSMIHDLKRKKKLNSKTLIQLLVPAVESLNLADVYLTQGVLKAMWAGCPYLKVLNFKDCGYIVTDNIVEQTLRKLVHLENLNLSQCNHITDKSLTAICRYGNNLHELNLSWIKGLSEAAILNLVETRTTLKHLDIYSARISPQGVERLVVMSINNNLKVALRDVSHQNDP